MDTSDCVNDPRYKAAFIKIRRQNPSLSDTQIHKQTRKWFIRKITKGKKPSKVITRPMRKVSVPVETTPMQPPDTTKMEMQRQATLIRTLEERIIKYELTIQKQQQLIQNLSKGETK